MLDLVVNRINLDHILVVCFVEWRADYVSSASSKSPSKSAESSSPNSRLIQALQQPTLTHSSEHAELPTFGSCKSSHSGDQVKSSEDQSEVIVVKESLRSDEHKIIGVGQDQGTTEKDNAEKNKSVTDIEDSLRDDQKVREECSQEHQQGLEVRLSAEKGTHEDAIRREQKVVEQGEKQLRRDSVDFVVEEDCKEEERLLQMSATKIRGGSKREAEEIDVIQRRVLEGEV